MVMAQSLFMLLKQRHPEATIDVLAPAWSLPLISRMPEVGRGIPMPAGHGELNFRKRRELGQRLRAVGYSRAIVLPRSLKAALVPWFAGIPRRTGFRGEMRYRLINDMRPLDRRLLDQTVKRFLALGLPRGETPGEIPLPRLDVSESRRAALIERLGIATARPVAAMMPGAEYGPAKCWPLESYAALATMLHAAGYDVWILGSENDRDAGGRVAAGGPARNLCGRTELVDAVDLLGGASLAVTNDSGLMHVAAAVGARVVALYGSSTPRYTPPLAKDATVHYLELDCSPCFERVCPLGHFRCLREIRPETVFDGIMRQNRENEPGIIGNAAKI